MKEQQRNIFIRALFERAKQDSNIMFLTCDFGAEALDDWRRDLPGQIIHTGISEQNTIDLASGLSKEGFTVYVYGMASFITMRCFEQIKVSLGASNRPVTILGVGPGYGYDDTGPTHYTTEDIAVMRTIPNIEIYSPSDWYTTERLVDLTIQSPKLRYIRLERRPVELNEHSGFEKGYNIVRPGRDGLIIAHGIMVNKALEIAEHFGDRYDVGVIDLFRLKPLNTTLFSELWKYRAKISLEEHFLNGGMGSILLEEANRLPYYGKLILFGSPDRYFFENGGREHVHELAGIDNKTVIEKLKKEMDAHQKTYF